jgi:hypothetical protein
MILIRIILISIAVYLVVRSLVKHGESGASSMPNQDSGKSSKEISKKVSKEIGEFVDYEEVKK